MCSYLQVCFFFPSVIAAYHKPEDTEVFGHCNC